MDGLLPTCQIVPAAGDPQEVRGRDEEHLRRFVAAREAGDAAEMRRCWELVVTDFAPRMEGFVELAHRGRLDDEEHVEALSMALARFGLRVMETFEGTSVGELVNACKRMAQYTCMDVQRASIRRRRHEGPSLDDAWDADPEEGAPPSWEAEAARRNHEREERAVDIAQFLAWALPQLTADRRAVAELIFDGVPAPEIVERLGITRDNAYQLKRRALQDLARLLGEWDA
jgi:hypothetical protein